MDQSAESRACRTGLTALTPACNLLFRINLEIPERRVRTGIRAVGGGDSGR
jgi:hypothetical protein